MSGTQDLQAIAGLMQVQQEVISNQLTLHIQILITMFTAVTIVASMLALVGYKGVRKYASDRAVEQANRNFKEWKRELGQNLIANLVDEGVSSNETDNNKVTKMKLVRKEG